MREKSVIIENSIIIHELSILLLVSIWQALRMHFSTYIMTYKSIFALLDTFDDF